MKNVQKKRIFGWRNEWMNDFNRNLHTLDARTNTKKTEKFSRVCLYEYVFLDRYEEKELKLYVQ
jgi:hypothetical protein